MQHSPMEPFPRVPVDQEAAAGLLRVAMFSAGHEALKPGPPSRIHNPDGSQQGETMNERDRRVVTAAVMHLIELGLLVVPEDVMDRLDDWLPLSRES